MVKTRHQTNDLLNTLAEELFDTIRRMDWDATRQVLRQIPQNRILPKVEPSVVAALLAVMFLNVEIPIDTLRDILAVVGPEGCLEHQGSDNCVLLHCCLLAEIDPQRLQVVAESCPEAVSARDIDGETPIDFLCRLEPNEYHSVDTIAEKVAILLRAYPEMAKMIDSDGKNIFYRAMVRGVCDEVLYVMLDAHPGLRS